MTRLDEPHLDARQVSEAFGQRRTHGFGLLHAIPELLARALVDDDGRNRGQRIAILACERGIGERQHEQGQRGRTHQRAAASYQHQQHSKHARDRERRPHDVFRHERCK